MSEEKEIKSLDELRELVRPILVMNNSTIRNKIINVARKEKQRDPAYGKAGQLALEVAKDFNYARAIGEAASWLVYLRKRHGLEEFEKMVAN